MKAPNRKTIKGISRRILALLIAIAFLLNSVSPALARSGNYGSSNSFTLTLMGAVSGLMSSSSTGDWGDFAKNVVIENVGSYFGTYMYVHYYQDYGQPIIKFNIGGKKVDISKGQLYTMVASTVACSLSGLASGQYSNATQFAVSFARDLGKNTAYLVVKETVKDMLHGYGVDWTLAEIAGDLVGKYAGKAVGAAILNSVGIISGKEVTEDGKLIEKEEAADNKKTEEQLQSLYRARENAKEERDLANARGDTQGAREAQSRLDRIDNKINLIRASYVSRWGHGFSPLSKSVAANLTSMGTGPILSASMKLLVLLALDYRTYRGGNRDKRFDNSMKMALANMAGEMAGLYGSERGSGGFKTEAMLRIAVSTATDMLWQNAIHKAGLVPDTTTELAHLLLAGAIRGNIRDSLARGVAGAALTADQPRDRVTNGPLVLMNMESYIYQMARGQNSIQAQGSLVTNSFRNEANRSIGVRVSALTSKKPENTIGSATHQLSDAQKKAIENYNWGRNITDGAKPALGKVEPKPISDGTIKPEVKTRIENYNWGRNIADGATVPTSGQPENNPGPTEGARKESTIPIVSNNSSPTPTEQIQPTPIDVTKRTAAIDDDLEAGQPLPPATTSQKPAEQVKLIPPATAVQTAVGGVLGAGQSRSLTQVSLPAESLAQSPEELTLPAPQSDKLTAPPPGPADKMPKEEQKPQSALPEIRYYGNETDIKKAQDELVVRIMESIAEAEMYKAGIVNKEELYERIKDIAPAIEISSDNAYYTQGDLQKIAERVIPEVKDSLSGLATEREKQVSAPAQAGETERLSDDTTKSLITHPEVIKIQRELRDKDAAGPEKKSLDLNKLTEGLPVSYAAGGFFSKAIDINDNIGKIKKDLDEFVRFVVAMEEMKMPLDDNIINLKKDIARVIEGINNGDQSDLRKIEEGMTTEIIRNIWERLDDSLENTSRNQTDLGTIRNLKIIQGYVKVILTRDTK